MTDGPRRPNQQLRREDDRRIVDIERRLATIDDRTNKIYEWLITEPEASPLGRTLVKRADTNANNIILLGERHDRDFERLGNKVDVLESWKDQAKGSLATARIIQVLLGIVVAGITVYTFVQPK